jgi:hypothetical protein
MLLGKAFVNPFAPAKDLPKIAVLVQIDYLSARFLSEL